MFAGVRAQTSGGRAPQVERAVLDVPPLFRLGSGAVLGDGPLLDAAADTHLGDFRPAFGQRDGDPPEPAAEALPGTLRPTFVYSDGPKPKFRTIAVFTLPAPTAESTPRLHLVVIALSAVVLATLGYMMARGAVPGTTGHRRENFNYRIPPEWSPEMEASYSFRAYMTDISMWIMLTDLQPHQQCAAIIMRLGGAAREMARMVTPQEMVNGGVMNGVAVDPVTYLLGSLHARFAALEEESRLSSMTEMLAFARRPGETINALLARYETVRQRAAIEGQFVMSIEGCSLQVLRACNIQSQHLFTLLQPFGGRLPRDDQQFRDMCTQLRRFGHISENAPGNIATALQGPFRQARPGAYLAQPDHDGPWHAAQGTLARYNPGSSERTFFGEDAAEHPGGFWDSLLPQPYDGQNDETFPTTDYGYQPISEQAYAAHAEMEEDDGTDTDTSSDDGLEEIPVPDTTHLSERDAAEQIYMAYRRAKRVWRRFIGKPVRRFRRAIKFQKRRRWKGKGKGKS